MNRKRFFLALPISCLIININITGFAQSGEPSFDGIPEGWMIIEGDVVVPEDFFENRGTYATNLWPGGIVPYEFDMNVSPDNQAAMRQAMDDWEAVANVSFIPRTAEPDYIHVLSGTGNWSHVGMIGGGQDLSIYNWSYEFIIVHELGHALALWHEQSRADRDDFVQIEYGNICQNCCPGGPCDYNFDIRPDPGGEYGTYDFDSLMHYGQCTFSVCGDCLAQPGNCRTITVLPPNEGWQDLIGQQDHLSTGDTGTMAFLYGPVGASLSDGSLEPPSGTDLTLFMFEVTYTDPAGQPPDLANVQVRSDGGEWIPYLMDHVDGSIETGALFQRVMQLPEGSYTHRFHFRAADQTELFWPDANGQSGPTVNMLDALQVDFWSDPEGVDAYEPGDTPTFYWEVRTPDGELCCDCELRLYITPPNPYVTPNPVGCGRWEYVGATNWEFGCDCYTFLANATHPEYASGQAVLEFHTCPPCPQPCPAAIIDPLTVSPHTIVPGCGPMQIDYCLNVDARVTIWIKDASGDVARRVIEPIAPDHNRAAGCWTDWWDGLDDEGDPVPEGEYFVEVEAIHLDNSHPMYRFAQTGQGEGEVGEVRGLAYDDSFVYVLTRAWGENKIVRYDRDGVQYVSPEGPLQEYKAPGPGSCQTSPYIQGLARDPQGRLYIRDDQPLPRITVWDASTWPPNCICPNLGYAQMSWPDHGEFAPIAYDPVGDRILTWARSTSVPDDMIYAFEAPCGPLDCPIDPTPDQNQPLWASGLAVDGLGNIWLATAPGTYVFDEPCGPGFDFCPDMFNARISIRYGRLLYYFLGGGVQVKDLRCNHLQSFCLDNTGFVLAEERFGITPEGQYIYAVGRPCGEGGDIRAVRIEDCNSATARTAPISVVEAAISVTEPNGDECWFSDTGERITWATCGTVGNVTIRLYDGEDEVPGVSPLAECVANSGEYCWDVPPTLPPGQSYRIRVEDCEDPAAIYDLGDAPFGVSCLADLDRDGDVGPEDLAIVLGNWGPCAEPCTPGDPCDTCRADFDGDCFVGAFDLAIVLGNWGPCE